MHARQGPHLDEVDLERRLGRLHEGGDGHAEPVLELQLLRKHRGPA